MGKTGFFVKKAVGTFFSLLKALINCKVSEKVMNGFRDISGRMDGRTDGPHSLGLQRLRRETKKRLEHFFRCLKP